MCTYACDDIIGVGMEVPKGLYNFIPPCNSKLYIFNVRKKQQEKIKDL